MQLLAALSFASFLEKFLLSSEPTELCLHIAGSVDHFQSEPSDAGWGCGYCNIQMLVSNLLKREVYLRDWSHCISSSVAEQSRKV